MTQQLDRATMDDLISALVRLEHKTTGAMTPNEYTAAATLCKAAQAPQFFIDYFTNKAQEIQQ